MKMVIFDFDGVLVDTLLICFALNSEVHKDLSMKEYQSFFEDNIYHAINAGKTKSIPDFDEKYKVKTRELKIPQVLKAILEDFSLKYNLAIVSSTPTSSIKNILDREQITTHFMEIFGSDVHQSKVVKIKMLLEKYKITPEEAVFVTDTVGDINEARECGMKSVAVTWGFHDEKTLLKGNPAKIVTLPEDLPKAVGEIL